MYHHKVNDQKKTCNNVPKTYERTAHGSSSGRDNWRARSNAKPLTVTRIKSK